LGAMVSTERWQSRPSPGAEAVRTLNRAIKVGTMAAPGTVGRTPLLSGEERERAYKVKDEWIRLNQQFLADGKVARQETHWGGEPSRVLYVHTFDVHGKRFYFHSYHAPVLLSEERAEDLPAYGTPMSEEQWAAMRMLGAQLLRVVRHGMSLYANYLADKDDLGRAGSPPSSS